MPPVYGQAPRARIGPDPVPRRRYRGAVPSRLRPTNPTAADAVLVGDPGRALFLAQKLLVNPLMSNHARGLWGYTAETPAGRPLTVQSTGMGGPSAAIVLGDLHRLGLRRAIRVGTCESLDPGLAVGDLVLVEAAIADDGAARTLSGATGSAGDREPIEPPGYLYATLRESGLPGAIARSDDLSSSVRRAAGLTGPDPLPGRSTVCDLQTATLFALAARLGVEIAAILVVEGPRLDGSTLDPTELEPAFARAGELAASAFS